MAEADLKMKSVLILKSEQLSLHNPNASDQYVETCKQFNLPTDVVHVLDFDFCNLPALLEKLNEPDKYAGIIFTSPRTVKAVALACDNILNEKWSKLPTFAVGERTSAIAKGVLGLDCLGSSSGCGMHLAQFIIKYKDKLNGKPLLLPHGNISKESVLDGLLENGITCDKVEVYITKLHPEFESSLLRVLSKREVRIVMFFSPSGVQFGLPLLRKHIDYIRDVQYLPIGRTTEKYLKDLGLSVFMTPGKPSPSGVAQVLEKIVL